MVVKSILFINFFKFFSDHPFQKNPDHPSQGVCARITVFRLISKQLEILLPTEVFYRCFDDSYNPSSAFTHGRDYPVATEVYLKLFYRLLFLPFAHIILPTGLPAPLNDVPQGRHFFIKFFVIEWRKYVIKHSYRYFQW